MMVRDFTNRWALVLDSPTPATDSLRFTAPTAALGFDGNVEGGITAAIEVPYSVYPLDGSAP